MHRSNQRDRHKKRFLFQAPCYGCTVNRLYIFRRPPFDVSSAFFNACVKTLSLYPVKTEKIAYEYAIFRRKSKNIFILGKHVGGDSKILSLEIILVLCFRSFHCRGDPRGLPRAMRITYIKPPVGFGLDRTEIECGTFCSQPRNGQDRSLQALRITKMLMYAPRIHQQLFYML